MKSYKNYTLKQYLDVLSRREPVPGGGSAAALSAALGASLISMVANYSLGKAASKASEKKIKSILKDSDKIRKRLLELVDFDAKAYLRVVAAKNASKSVKKSALIGARKISKEVCKLCYKAVNLTPYLVEKGNKNLIGDVNVAVELLQAGFNGSLALLKL